ncbi:hypothetical protein FQA39_LY02552 [Lamprigera yunnana]|nr:hypothetical protein FQA39_LY02552 [Lamprigera yunnana]
MVKLDCEIWCHCRKNYMQIDLMFVKTNNSSKEKSLPKQVYVLQMYQKANDAPDDKYCVILGVCFFPERWEGTWFQSGVRQPIIIEGPKLTSKGRCIASEGDKFLVVDEKSCYRCVVIHEKHENVLQYKETYCYGKESLQTLCSSITGDALLYSMFRENAAPISCPFRGPFTFTYNRGSGECKSPVSSIDTCTEDSRLLLSYQACPDIHSSESTVEELQCLAVWKEGSSRYLVGKVHHSHATSNEDRFRCFVYEKASVASEALDGIEFRVSQSGDATCNGLFIATDGSRTMNLKRGTINTNSY